MIRSVLTVDVICSVPQGIFLLFKMIQLYFVNMFYIYFIKITILFYNIIKKLITFLNSLTVLLCPFKNTFLDNFTINIIL